MIVAVVSMWVITVVLFYFLGLVFGLGLMGVWIAMTLDEWTRGLLMFKRWRSKKWLSKAIIRAKVE